MEKMSYDKNQNEEETVTPPPLVDQLVQLEGDAILIQQQTSSTQQGDVELEVNGNTKKLDACLQVERIHLSGEPVDHSLKHTAADADVDADSSFINSNECGDKRPSEEFSKKNALGSLLTNDDQNAPTASAEITPESRNDALTDSASVSENCTSSAPDFSILKGEIRLDNLSIKELQEAFRAAFGRHTTVKDKLWLKRRIAMGLTNCCDVPTTSFVIKNNKIIYNEINGESSKLESEVVSPLKDEISDPPTTTNPLRHKRPTRSTSPQNDDCQMDQFSSKRMRKPTKRYVELSDVDTCESTAKVAGEEKSSRKYQTGFLGGVSTKMSFSTRYDSFGGFGILIPYASRVRIGRPRKNIMALMKYHPSDKLSNITETARTPVQQPEAESGSFLPVCLLQPSFVNNKEVELESQSKDELDTENKEPDAHIDDGDDNIDSQSLVKTGVKRKHHRAWTLSEVLKLVEGVAMFGAGRWSEIRRIAFASYSYRTSVDLKDKWRNLLRASLSQAPGSGHLRKHTSMPIPPAVLSRVRELAEKHGKAGIHPRPSKPASHGVKGSAAAGFL